MTRWNGRISSSVQNRRNNYVPRRPLSESKNNCSVEQQLTSTSVHRNADQRCIVFTLVSPEIEDYIKLAAFIQTVSCVSQGKDIQPAPHSEPAPAPAPALTLLFNLHKEENKIEVSENTCPPDTSQMDIMSRSHNRNERTKSFKDLSSNSSHTYIAADTSSGSPCDSLSPISSDDLVSDITVVDNKPPKRNSKKKGKKKGKHHKVSPCIKDSSELSEDVRLPPLLNTDATAKMEGRDVNSIAESSQTVVPCISNNDDETKSSTDVIDIDSDHRCTPINIVIPIESDTRESYYSEGVFHAHSSTEKSQYSIDECSSNDFQPVMSSRRGRSSRKLNSYSGKDVNNCSVWKKVQKDNISPKVDTSSKGSSYNSNQKPNLGKNNCNEMVGGPPQSSVTSIKKKQGNNYLRKGPPIGNSNHARPAKIDAWEKVASNILANSGVKSADNITAAKSSQICQNQVDVNAPNTDINVNGFENISSDLQCQSIVAGGSSVPQIQNPKHEENSEIFVSPLLIDTKSSVSEVISVEPQFSSRSGDDADCSSSETEISSVSYLETSLSSIFNASTDSYRLQAAASIHMAESGPLAEFERFMLSATPVINQSHHIDSNVSLASVWQWYEEPGCFGLEVKAKDMYKCDRLPDSLAEFSAYFVPFLSAVQLFGKSHQDVSVSVASSYLSAVQILPDLLPGRGNTANSEDVKLIFEYFEHAHPPHRQPLFEKIKEFVCDDGAASNENMYGSPSALESLDLCDLHPASWYAVAWYPICRIPEGNFRAAFLTYHSLGYFDKQSGSSNTADRNFSGIISPVVGLQSYNAKKECWFQPKSKDPKVLEKEESSTSSSSTKLLEERLQMLEKTASVMATATVCKGNMKSINNHPDYNHFFSRW